jgi:hypothetical protein
MDWSTWLTWRVLAPTLGPVVVTGIVLFCLWLFVPGARDRIDRKRVADPGGLLWFCILTLLYTSVSAGTTNKPLPEWLFPVSLIILAIASIGHVILTAVKALNDAGVLPHHEAKPDGKQIALAVFAAIVSAGIAAYTQALVG